MEDPNVGPIAIEHLEGEKEVFPLVAVRDEKGFGGAVVFSVQVKLLHILQ